jgi:genome maintenance exonuclease 1
MASNQFIPEPEKQRGVTGTAFSRESTRVLAREVGSNMTEHYFTYEPNSVIEEIQPYFSVDTRPTGRVYTFKGQTYESITTVLGRSKKKSIEEWRTRVGEETADRITRYATENGTRVHDLAERLLKNDPISSDEIIIESPFVITAYRALEKILRSKVKAVHSLESALYSDNLGVAGRVDCVGVFDDCLSIIDFKTARSDKKHEHIHTYFMQEAAYALMWDEITGVQIDQLVTIMAIRGDSYPEVFVEQRKDWEKPLLRTLAENRGSLKKTS